jgi:hypothetical protein
VFRTIRVQAESPFKSLLIFVCMHVTSSACLPVFAVGVSLCNGLFDCRPFSMKLST